MRCGLLSHRAIAAMSEPRPRRRFRLSLILCVLFVAASVDALPMYRFQGQTGSASYLLGTLHSEDPRVLAVVDELTCLIDKVDVVAVELLPDAVVMAAAAAAMLLPKGQQLVDQVGSERWAKLQRIAADADLPAAFVSRLKPWAAAVTLGLPIPQGEVLDLVIARTAAAKGRRVVGLESAADQLGVFDRMPLHLQLELVDETIKNAEIMPTVLQALTEAYLDGELQELQALTRAQYKDVSAALGDWFQQVLLNERNAAMVQQVLSLLRDESVLVAVGALHLAGEEGLVVGLRKAGIDVKAVEVPEALVEAGCALRPNIGDYNARRPDSGGMEQR